MGVAAVEDENWVLGFVTGYNYLMVAKQNRTIFLMENIDNNGVFSWLDNYCANNPTESISNASGQLGSFLAGKELERQLSK